jgi:hypothetical protein
MKENKKPISYAAQRKAKQRVKEKESGLIRFEVRIKPEWVEKIKEFIKSLGE